jgi:PAS domain S-box-containing protein
VLKDGLGRLGPAVLRALERKRLRDEKRLAEQRLLASEQRFRALIEHSSDGIALLGRDAGILYASPSTMRIMGYAVEELIGRSAFELVHRDDVAAVRDSFEKVLQSPGAAVPDMFRVLHKDQSWRWVETVGTNLLDERAVEAIVINYRDMTERRQTEERLRKLSRAIEQSPSSIMITSTKGAIEYANPKFTEVTGYTFDEVRGENPRILKSGEMPAEGYQVLWETITSGREWRGEFHNKKKNGELFWESASISPVLDEHGIITHFIAIKEDITEQKRVARELASSHERLASQAQEMTRSNRELEQFAYVASHDLQEPLRMVASYLELLADRYKGQLDEKADKFINYAVDGATRMKRLIDDLLGYSRVTTRPRVAELIEVGTALDEATTNLGKAIAERGAVVTQASLPSVVVDRTHLVQVFQNLIGNALKFCDGTPRIHVWAERHEREWVLAVRDNGIGIAPEHRERIFQIFQRLHGRGKYAGTGIGLAICKKIVEQYGGRIWVESQPGKGSTFFFTLPAVD